MSITPRFYPSAVKHMFDGEILTAHTFKVALLQDVAGAAYNGAHTTWANVSSTEAAGTGYAPGGATITTVDATYDTTKTSFTISEVMWEGLAAVFKNAVIYDETSGKLLMHLAFQFLQSPGGRDYILSAPSPVPTATPTVPA